MLVEYKGSVPRLVGDGTELKYQFTCEIKMLFWSNPIKDHPLDATTFIKILCTSGISPAMYSVRFVVKEQKSLRFKI